MFTRLEVIPVLSHVSRRGVTLPLIVAAFALSLLLAPSSIGQNKPPLVAVVLEDSFLRESPEPELFEIPVVETVNGHQQFAVSGKYPSISELQTTFRFRYGREDGKWKLMFFQLDMG